MFRKIISRLYWDTYNFVDQEENFRTEMSNAETRKGEKQHHNLTLFIYESKQDWL